MPATPLPALVLFVSDVERVSRFYLGISDLQLMHQDADHAVLEGWGFQLVMHRIHGETPAAPGEPVVREDSYTKLCLPVASIAQARAAASAHGGFVKGASSEWAARGFRACDGHDPEGNVLQVREAAP